MFQLQLMTALVSDTLMRMLSITNPHTRPIECLPPLHAGTFKEPHGQFATWRQRGYDLRFLDLKEKKLNTFRFSRAPLSSALACVRVYVRERALSLRECITTSTADQQFFTFFQ